MSESTRGTKEKKRNLKSSQGNGTSGNAHGSSTGGTKGLSFGDVVDKVTAEHDKNKKKYMKYNSLFVFSPQNRVRGAVDKLINSMWFEYFIFLAIVVNIITLASFDPQANYNMEEFVAQYPNTTMDVPAALDEIEDAKNKNRILNSIDYALLGVYSAEAILKIFVMGFVLHKDAYLRDFWNALDLIVVIAGYLAIAVPALAALTILRIFRPLRLIAEIPKLKRIIIAMVKSLPFLANAVVLMLIFFFVFGITGVEMFGGALRRHCVDNETLEIVDVNEVCRINSGPSWIGGHYCAENQICERTNLNPNENVTGFDTFPQAALTLFQAVTLEGWVDIAYWLMDASTDFSVIYTALIPLLGAYFFINLFLATVQGAFQAAASTETEYQKAERKKKSLMWRFKNWLKRPPKDASDQGCLGRYYAFGRACQAKIFGATWFKNLRDIVIIINIVVLSMKYYGEDPVYASVLRWISVGCLIFYSIELVGAFIAYGIYDFLFVEKLNPFDTVVVIASWIQYGVTGGRIAGAFSVFRIFRLLRLFKYLPSWRKVNNLTDIFPKIVPLLFYNFILLLLFMFMFAVLGMQLFGGKYPLDDTIRPRFHFDSFFSAFLTTFVIITLENWNSLMYETVKYSGTIWSSLYYIGIIVITNYMLLNLFLSILLEALQDVDEEEEKQNKNAASDNDGKTVELDNMNKEGNADAAKDPATINSSSGISQEQTIGSDLKRLGGESKKKTPDVVTRPRFQFIASRAFFWVFTILIILSCVTLIVDSYEFIKSNNTANNVLFAVDVFYAVAFTVELVLYVLGRPSALRRGSTWFDILALLVMYIDVGTWSLGYAAIKALRATRPLRLLFRFKNTRRFLRLLFDTLPTLPSVLPIGLFIWILFAVLGLQLFAGGFNRCNDPDPSILTRDMCVGNFTHPETGEVIEREWVAPDDNFNHFLNALFTIFKMSGSEGWPDVLTNAMDVVGPDHTPVRSNNLWSAFYFYAFVPLGVWFVLGLVVGTIVDTFNNMRKARDSLKLYGFMLSDDQRHWIEMKLQILVALPEKLPERPSNACRAKVWDMVTSKAFSYTISAIIFINVLILCMNWYHTTGVKDEWTDLQLYADYVFTAIYIVEFVLKLIAFGLHGYFTNGWNILDFIIVVISVIGAIGSFIPSFSSINNLAKAFRVARVLRLLKVTTYFKRLHTLFKTAVLSIPSMYNAFLILLIIYFAFAIIGNALFKNLPEGEQLNRRANFDSILNALFLCYRMSTGEAWNRIMYDVVYATSGWSYIYFIVFVILVNFVLIQMFTAVIIDNFQIVNKVGGSNELSIKDYESVAGKWAIFDRHSTGRIHVLDLIPLLSILKPPLGLGKKASKGAILNLINSLELYPERSYVYLPDVIVALTQRVTDKEIKPEVLEALRNEWKKRFMKKHSRETPVFFITKGLDVRQYKASEVISALILQRAWRAALHRVRNNSNSQPKKSKRKKKQPARLVEVDEGEGEVVVDV